MQQLGSLRSAHQPISTRSHATPPVQNQLIQQHVVLAILHLPRNTLGGAGGSHDQLKACSTSLQVLLGLGPGQVRELHVAGACGGRARQRARERSAQEMSQGRARQATVSAVSTGHRRGDSGGLGRPRVVQQRHHAARAPVARDRAREQVVQPRPHGRTSGKEGCARLRPHLHSREQPGPQPFCNSCGGPCGRSNSGLVQVACCTVPSAVAIHRHSWRWPTG